MTYADYEWFLKEDFSSYAGQWVAIIDQNIVAAGRNLSEVLKETKNKYPAKRPFLSKIRSGLAILSL